MLRRIKRFLRPRVILLLLAASLILLVVVLLSIRRERQLIGLTFETGSIMGTETRLRVVVPAGRADAGRAAIDAAVEELRRIERHLSVYLGTSEVSRFNATSAGRLVPLSPETLDLLRASRDLSSASHAAFDPSCRPVLELWKQCEQEDRLPERTELEAVLGWVGWRWIRLQPNGAEKLKDQVEIDLGGIGKGYAVDRAIRAMRRKGALGGMLQCGGEIGVFGTPDHEGPWKIAIRDPFSSTGTLERSILLAEGAVSTSGNYERYYSIRGKKYSHIVDPRTGLTVDAVPQVTVIARTSTQADGWSTALTVLGPDGLKLLPAGADALVVLGTGADARIFKTRGFEAKTIH